MSLYIDRVKKRDKLQTYSDILKQAIHPMKKTRVMTACVIQFEIFNKLVPRFIDLRLLEWEGDKLKTTKEGQEVMRRIDELYKLFGEN